MKKIFSLVLMIALLAVVVIPQVQAVSWKTYTDPQGRFSMEYPGWTPIRGGSLLVMFMGPPSGDSNIMAWVAAIHDKSKFTRAGKEDEDTTTTVEGWTTRTKMICGEKYGGIFCFCASAGDLDSASKTTLSR